MSAQSCENERSAALRQKISSRVRAPAFAGATTGVRGGRNALGAPLEALQRPHATSYHLLTTFVPLTPTSEKHYPNNITNIISIAYATLAPPPGMPRVP